MLVACHCSPKKWRNTQFLIASMRPFKALSARPSHLVFGGVKSCNESRLRPTLWVFCLDEISFRRDYKSCRIGVVVVVRSFVPHLWKLCDGITFVILELHFWDLVHCSLISFCSISEILKKIGPPQPPKKTKNPQKKTWIFTMGYLANALS